MKSGRPYVYVEVNQEYKTALKSLAKQRGCGTISELIRQIIIKELSIHKDQNLPEILNFKQAKEFLGISSSTLYKSIRFGEISPHMVDGLERHYFTQTELKKYQMAKNHKATK